MINQTITEQISPAKLTLLTNLTMFLAIIGLIIGLPLLYFNFNLPSMEGLEHDTREHTELSLKYIMQFFGMLFTFLGIAGLIGSLLMQNKSWVGWLILVGLYSCGLICGFYVFYLLISIIITYDLNLLILMSASSLPLFLVFMIWVVFGLYTLFHNTSREYIFRS